MTDLKLWFPELNEIQMYMINRIITEARIEELEKLPLDNTIAVRLAELKAGL